MFLRIFDLQDARSCLRWEHTTRTAIAHWDPPREPLPTARTTRAKKQSTRPPPAPTRVCCKVSVATEPVDDFVHVPHAQDEEMHDFELV